MRASRGTLTEPGKGQPVPRAQRRGEPRPLPPHGGRRVPDGTHVLRAKIDMASANINLRDPAIYRIRHATHHRAGDTWNVYPMYTFAHPIEDALERITHSICTLEFEDQRPFYDWLLERLAEGGLLAQPLPQQIEFARLNLSYVVLSKRKLIQLVQEKHVDGWDDPRLPTLVGARRRGYTPEGFRAFAERIGVAKADSWIDYGVLEECMRDDLNERAPRRIAVLDPLKLVIDNYPEGRKRNASRPTTRSSRSWASAPCPSRASCGSSARISWRRRRRATSASSRQQRAPALRLRREVHRLRQGCRGKVTAVHCEYLPDSKSGTPGADTYKVKGNLHWVSAKHAYAARCGSTTACSAEANPGAGERDYLADLNPDAKRVIAAQLEEPALKDAKPEDRFQFERHGYFVADRVDSKPGAPVFNRAVTLKDSWAPPPAAWPTATPRAASSPPAHWPALPPTPPSRCSPPTWNRPWSAASASAWRWPASIRWA
jgi:glutaminyl-tRNA synthetase